MSAVFWLSVVYSYISAAGAVRDSSSDLQRGKCAAGPNHMALTSTKEAGSAAKPYVVFKAPAAECCETCTSNVTGCGAFMARMRVRNMDSAVQHVDSVCALFDHAAAAHLHYVSCNNGQPNLSSGHECSSAISPTPPPPPSLPTCRKLMSRPNSPFANGDFLTRATTQVVWKLLADGSRRLTLPTTCQLHQYTATEAKQCLAGKSMALIGDSLTRYSFMSLAYFLETGAWSPRFKMESPCRHLDEAGNPTCSANGHPSFLSEGDWQKGGKRGWKSMIFAMSGEGDGGVFNGRLECPCYKLSGSPTAYNMQYVSDTQTVLTYISENGWGDNPNPIFGWDFTGCASNASCRFTEDTWGDFEKKTAANNYDFNYTTIAKAVAARVAKLQHVDYVLYNRGLWGTLKVDVSDKIMNALFNWTGPDSNEEGQRMRISGGRCFFRSTTACDRALANRLAESERNLIRKSAAKAGCEFFDVLHITEEFGQLPFTYPEKSKLQSSERGTIFWDAVHYQPWVYEELNNLLLNVLCNTATP